jgi:hypothetical protein
MRISQLSIAVLVATAGVASAGVAEPGAVPPDPRSTERARTVERTLSLSEIDAQVKPVSDEISRCFLGATGGERGGQLLVQLAIHRRGTLDAVTVSAPGVPAKLVHKIEACVRGVVEALEFPARRAPTTAVLPYQFQRTVARGAGPQPSCFSSRGCRGR